MQLQTSFTMKVNFKVNLKDILVNKLCDIEYVVMHLLSAGA